MGRKGPDEEQKAAAAASYHSLSPILLLLRHKSLSSTFNGIFCLSHPQAKPTPQLTLPTSSELTAVIGVDRRATSERRRQGRAMAANLLEPALQPPVGQ